jgi:hypothetical protein
MDRVHRQYITNLLEILPQNYDDLRHEMFADAENRIGKLLLNIPSTFNNHVIRNTVITKYAENKYQSIDVGCKLF